MKTYQLTNIEWDTTPETPEALGLPNSMTVGLEESDVEDADPNLSLEGIAVELAVEEIGWMINHCKVKAV